MASWGAFYPHFFVPPKSRAIWGRRLSLRLKSLLYVRTSLSLVNKHSQTLLLPSVEPLSLPYLLLPNFRHLLTPAYLAPYLLFLPDFFIFFSLFSNVVGNELICSTPVLYYYLPIVHRVILWCPNSPRSVRLQFYPSRKFCFGLYEALPEIPSQYKKFCM